MHMALRRPLFFTYVMTLALWAAPLSSSLHADAGGEPSSISDAWVATDALGRKLPDHAEVGDPRPNRTVAMFYWTWHVGGTVELGPANVSEVLARHPDAINDYNHPAWKELGPIVGHHWNEPLFGYYRGTDPWIYRKHAEMLADAGVDVVVFDCTNGTLTWKEAYDVLGETWMAARRDGVRGREHRMSCGRVVEERKHVAWGRAVHAMTSAPAVGTGRSDQLSRE
jgi:hypothetical protein